MCVCVRVCMCVVGSISFVFLLKFYGPWSDTNKYVICYIALHDSVTLSDWVYFCVHEGCILL